MILWHLAAILLTFILVASGFDWHYFHPNLRSWMFPVVQIGGLYGHAERIADQAAPKAAENSVA